MFYLPHMTKCGNPEVLVSAMKLLHSVINNKYCVYVCVYNPSTFCLSFLTSLETQLGQQQPSCQYIW